MQSTPIPPGSNGLQFWFCWPNPGLYWGPFKTEPVQGQVLEPSSRTVTVKYRALNLPLCAAESCLSLYARSLTCCCALCRSPPLTLLHLSASKFMEAPGGSTGSITSFLSSDISATQKESSATSPAPRSPIGSSRAGLAPKQLSTIQSFFQKAAEKQERRDAESQATPTKTPPAPSPQPSALSPRHQAERKPGTSSFFQRKTLESKLQIVKDPACPADGPPPPPTLPAAHDDQPSWGGTGASSTLAGEKGRGPAETGTPPHESGPPSSPSGRGNVDSVKCDRCGQQVSAWDTPEHADYHFALDLQSSFSSSSSASPHPAADSPKSPRGKTKLKSQSGPQAKKFKSQGSHPTLDSFFKRT